MVRNLRTKAHSYIPPVSIPGASQLYYDSDLNNSLWASHGVEGTLKGGTLKAVFV